MTLRNKIYNILSLFVTCNRSDLIEDREHWRRVGGWINIIPRDTSINLLVVLQLKTYKTQEYYE